jgi:hypothetical protein
MPELSSRCSKGGRLYKVLGDAELTLEIVEAGHLFGVVPALARRPHSTYAEALAPSLVALISTLPPARAITQRVSSMPTSENPASRRLGNRA